MKTARYRDVPKDYRRNYVKEFFESVMILAMTFGIITILVLLSA
jgi:hypothetical protein